MNVLTFLAIMFGVVAAFTLLPLAIVAYCQWRMRKLWEKMTPEQRIWVSCKEMAEAVRQENNR